MCAGGQGLNVHPKLLQIYSTWWQSLSFRRCKTGGRDHKCRKFTVLDVNNNSWTLLAALAEGLSSVGIKHCLGSRAGVIDLQKAKNTRKKAKFPFKRQKLLDPQMVLKHLKIVEVLFSRKA